MKIIKSSFEIINPVDRNEGVGMLRRIERFGRISHRSEDRQTEDSWERFIQAVVMGHGDWSIVEHATASVIFRVDRGVTHELVRHRLFSFTQESTRFVNGRKHYPEGLEFIQPEKLLPGTEGCWFEACEDAEASYFDLLDMNVRPQEARSVLPNCLAATIAMTGNLRNWRHVFLMRTTQETHPDLRAVMIPLLEWFQQLIPIIFSDIEPNARQIKNMQKAR